MLTINYNEYEKLIKEIENLSKLKNQLYGCDGLIAFSDLGCIIRIYDKINRIKNLYEKEKSQKILESIEDNLIDIINYAIYALLIKRKKLTNEKPR